MSRRRSKAPKKTSTSRFSRRHRRPDREMSAGAHSLMSIQRPLTARDVERALNLVLRQGDLEEARKALAFRRAEENAKLTKGKRGKMRSAAKEFLLAVKLKAIEKGIDKPSPKAKRGPKIVHKRPKTKVPL